MSGPTPNQPPSDPTRSQAFQPVSYELAPEYSVPDAPNHRPQDGYQGNAGYPGHAGYPAPPHHAAPYESAPHAAPPHHAAPHQAGRPMHNQPHSGASAQPAYPGAAYGGQSYPAPAQPGPAYPGVTGPGVAGHGMAGPGMAGPGVAGQPAYPGYPAAGHPGQPGGAQIGYPGAVAPGVPLAAPPAPTRRRGVWIAGAVAAVVLLCCGAGAVVASPILGEYPATLSMPAQMSGLTKLDDPQLQKAADKVKTQLSREVGSGDVVAGFYAENGDKARIVAIVGATTLLLDPAGELDDAFGGMRDGGLTISDVRDYDAGELGGSVQCGTTSMQSVKVSVCGWADHGSLVLGLFFNRPVEDSAKLFRGIRGEVLHR